MKKDGTSAWRKRIALNCQQQKRKKAKKVKEQPASPVEVLKC
jgi:hypothetical protein